MKTVCSFFGPLGYNSAKFSVV